MATSTGIIDFRSLHTALICLYWLYVRQTVRGVRQYKPPLVGHALSISSLSFATYATLLAQECLSSVQAQTFGVLVLLPPARITSQLRVNFAVYD